MSNRLLKTVTLLAFTALSTAALAAEPPATVGRISLAQGQVSVASDGEPASGALVNWPVTSQQTITTAPGARTELRIGSTSVRLDGGSALEVVQLDDQDLRLRLHYGSAYVRILDPEVVPGFVLETAQARLRMREPGGIRVDADRTPDTTTFNVFGGVAMVEGAGEQLTVRAGRRAEVRDDGSGAGDVRTAQAVRDGFDDWSFARDHYQDNARSARYVTSDMTGYEDLDRYGRWSTDAEYGNLWIPSVASSWVPYRDGSWVWLDPWGWTWVDNAPWGYAPFHYGRWVYVHRHWAWAPGRHERHPVWSPALVGWVGGAGFSLSFGSHRSAPARGWYPLAPHERYVPAWHASDDHLRRWNHDVRDDRRHDFGHRQGLTVVPHDAFTQRGRVPVAHQPHATMPPPVLAQAVPAAAPPPPREHHAPRAQGRGEHDRFERGQHAPSMPAPVLSNRQPQPGAVTAPRQQQEARQVIVAAPPAPGVLTAPPVAHRGAPWDRGQREQQQDARRQQDARPAHDAHPDQDTHRGQDGRREQDARREQDGRRWQDGRREQAAPPSAMPAPAPAPLQAVPSPNPGEPPVVGHGRPPHGFAERERRQHEMETAPPPSRSPLIAQPETARPFPLPPQARAHMEPPETARPMPLPPQARPHMEPPETARPMPLPPQARAQMAPPEMARPMPLPPQAMQHQAAPPPPPVQHQAAPPPPPVQHPAQAAPPSPPAQPAHHEEHGRGGDPRNPRQQER